MPCKPATALRPLACLAGLLTCLAPPSSGQEMFTSPELVVVGKRDPAKQIHFDSPPLTVVGIPHETRFISPQLTVVGGVDEASPKIIDFPPLTAAGIPTDASPRILDFPALVAIGLSTARPVQIFDFPALTATGMATASPAAPSPALEMVELPQGPVSGKYLRLDSASFSRDMPLNIRYSGLPDKAGTIVLFYTGGAEPKRSAWYYTRADKQNGVFERGAGSLPSFTGTWQACVGFDVAARASDAKPADFAECIGFVLAGAGTLDANPDIQLPDEPIRAGKFFTIHYAGMPAVNASITLTLQGESRPSTSFLTSSRPTGDLQVRLDRPGTYELKLFFTGEAVRARLLLEVKP